MRRFAFALLLFHSFSHASVVGEFTVIGVIKNFDEKEVTLVDPRGNKFKVPRSQIERTQKVKSGAKVVVHLPVETLQKKE